MTVELAATPLGPLGIVLTVVVANAIAAAILLAVLWWMRRVPSRLRDRAAGGANPVTVDGLTRRDPRTAGAPTSVTGLLTADAGPEVISPVTRRGCALFRVELDRLSDLEGMHGVGRQATVCSGVPAVLTDRTGSLLIDPEVIVPDPEWLTDTRRTGLSPGPGELYVRPLRGIGTTGFVQREFVVPSGTTVTVVGRMTIDSDGWLRPAGRDGSLTLTSKAAADLVAAGPLETASWRRLRQRAAAVGLVTVGAMNVALLLGVAR